VENQPLQQFPGWKVASLSPYWYGGDALGDGYFKGNHGGSPMSTTGGTIRLGELLNDGKPIQHALKLELFAQDWCYKLANCTANVTCSYPFNWPAYQQDGAPNGTNPYLSWGSLLAVPRNVSSALNMSTVPGKKILQALTDYGGYLVDATAWNVASIVMDVFFSKRTTSLRTVGILNQKETRLFSIKISHDLQELATCHQQWNFVYWRWRFSKCSWT
jgi:hypothetical protein